MATSRPAFQGRAPIPADAVVNSFLQQIEIPVTSERCSLHLRHDSTPTGGRASPRARTFWASQPALQLLPHLPFHHFTH